MTKTARAYTNIALIKYWGKKNKKLKLPYTNSLSLTLDKFYTDTKSSVIDNDEDIVSLNGEILDFKKSLRIKRYLDVVRKMYDFDEHLKIESVNHVPLSAGFASSASGFAALAASINSTMKLNLTNRQISTLARNGSGSASRSIYGGFVEWHAGNDNDSSYSEPIDENPKTDIVLLSVVISEAEKTISSTNGMELSVNTSPFYTNWSTLVASEIIEIKQAIAQNDLQKIGEISEHNALSMHALTLSANPPFTYFAPETIKIIQIVKALRQKGILAYVTIDAGPNVKIICSNESVNKVKNYINEQLPKVSTFEAHIGKGIQYI
ncbi:diphosphomevalonate decarboxylase [Companilactobacillus ginsenosidimutans]|uniref:diphosphomevalonate decarboxylase n=1 Tax=Companilactobacillus ginsenosidimutans TaxID=1007676 RepID=A0A0H4QHU4_9LACO|nr:diphosphomevalonate decarboxylase [Companilactobacillus ginsenosidimutans]AKP66591.1 diphosphomevalonate decarboxylase [Companilactobacillus ginsenosidimutans]